MRAIIIDRPNKNSKPERTVDYSNIFSRVLNIPLVVRNIKKLKAQGIEQITVLTDQQVPREFRDGLPWGVELTYTSEIEKQMVDNESQNWLILPGNVVLDLDFSKFEVWHVMAEATVSYATPRAFNRTLPEQYIHPTMMTAEALRNGATEKGSLSAVALINLANRLHQKPYTVELVDVLSDLSSNLDFWNAHHVQMVADIDTDTLQGFPLSDNVWVDLNTRVDDSVETNGFVLMGKNCKIHRDVEFKGFVVIEDDVIIDRGAIIENSIIRNNTYIGSEVSVKNAVVNQSRLYRADYDSILKVEDQWLMGVNHTSSYSKWINRSLIS